MLLSNDYFYTPGVFYKSEAVFSLLIHYARHDDVSNRILAGNCCTENVDGLGRTVGLLKAILGLCLNPASVFLNYIVEFVKDLDHRYN